ncbi:MAG: alpha/beta hydrolase-fold protein, partial [Opitutaceae bacterium]
MKSSVLAALLVVTISILRPALGGTFAETDLHILLERLDSMERSAQHPLFARHCRSLRALVQSGWARAQLFRPHSNMPELLRADLAEIAAGLDRGNDRWEAFRDAGQALVLAFLSERDQTLQLYHLVLPRDWDESRAYPLHVELHGSGGPEMRPLSWVKMTLGPAPNFEKKHCPIHTYAMIERDGFHVLPYGRGNSNYEDIGEIDIWEALADAEANLKIDPERRYLYGFSMGGSGAYLLAARRPELWAAVAIIGGSPGLRDAPEELAQSLAPLPLFSLVRREGRVVRQRKTESASPARNQYANARDHLRSRTTTRLPAMPSTATPRAGARVRSSRCAAISRTVRCRSSMRS